MRLKTKSPLEALYPLFVANLVKLYRSTSPATRETGRAWYPNARRIVRDLAATHARPETQVADVIAALSPQCEWTRNVVAAENLLAGNTVAVVGPYRANILKAQRILHSGADIATVFPKGPKVNCFASNLAGDDWLVTVDTHAAQAARNCPTWFPGLSMAPYQVIAQAYQRAATRCGETPAAFQAIIWLEWKARYPRERKRQLQRTHGRHTRKGRTR